jgi:hypothetical protein
MTQWERSGRHRVRGTSFLAIGVAIVAAFAIAVLICVGYAHDWTGFGRAAETESVRPYKTLWDWLELLIVPAALAIGGFMLTRSESRATATAVEQRSQEGLTSIPRPDVPVDARARATILRRKCRRTHIGPGANSGDVRTVGKRPQHTSCSSYTNPDWLVRPA